MVESHLDHFALCALDRTARNIGGRIAMGKMATGALLMCSVLVLVAVAPLAQSDDTVHTIYKGENGPPSTCNAVWTFEAPSAGTWWGHVVDEDEDMRWIILHVEDTTGPTPVIVVDRIMYRFAEHGNDFVTDSVPMDAGHSYEITVTPNCPLYGGCTVEDVFEGVGPIPPVAFMDVTIDSLSVSVDGSASYDDDGTIEDYQWDFGDGSTASGVTATHTYEIPMLPFIEPGVYGDPQVQPYSVIGITMDGMGDPIPYCTVYITNLRTEEYCCVVSNDVGGYKVDIRHGLESGILTGDWIQVKAVKGTLSGVAEGQVNLALPLLPLDVTLEETPIEPFQVTITLTVTDNDGEFSSVSETITLPGGA